MTRIIIDEVGTIWREALIAGGMVWGAELQEEEERDRRDLISSTMKSIISTWQLEMHQSTMIANSRQD